MRLQDALVARVDAFDRERAARAAAERAGELQDRFLATVSHELRTPLNAIVGWAHVIKAGIAIRSRRRSRAIDGIERNARAQAKLISDLLDISQLIRGRLPVKHGADGSAARRSASAVESARPRADGKGSRPRLYGPMLQRLQSLADDARLEQIVSNLLSNAVKFTPRGGRVGVKVLPDDELSRTCR